MRYNAQVGDSFYTVHGEYPHEYTQGFSYDFDTLDEAEEYATAMRKGSWGHENYCRVSVSKSQLMSSN